MYNTYYGPGIFLVLYRYINLYYIILFNNGNWLMGVILQRRNMRPRKMDAP